MPIKLIDLVPTASASKSSVILIFFARVEFSHFSLASVVLSSVPSLNIKSSFKVNVICMYSLPILIVTLCSPTSDLEKSQPINIGCNTPSSTAIVLVNLSPKLLIPSVLKHVIMPFTEPALLVKGPGIISNLSVV